jgi:hypothetical protein
MEEIGLIYAPENRPVECHNKAACLLLIGNKTAVALALI